MSKVISIMILDSLTYLSEMDLAKAEEILASYRKAYPEMVAFGEQLARQRVDDKTLADILDKVELPKQETILRKTFGTACTRCHAFLKKRKCRVCGTFN